MKSILFLITCCASFCFAASDSIITIQEVTQEVACGKCKNPSCKGCRGRLACGNDLECPCGCKKKDLQELAGCGCKGKGKTIHHACSSRKKGKRRAVVPVIPATSILGAC